jgi:hypothetical protein
MSKGATGPRKEKRKQFQDANYLKIKNMFGRLSPKGVAWSNQMREQGKLTHEANTNRIKDEIEDELQCRVNIVKETWIKSGYNEAEIKMLEEAFFINNIKNKENRKEDNKRAKLLMKEASNSLKNRTNADS